MTNWWKKLLFIRFIHVLLKIVMVMNRRYTWNLREVRLSKNLGIDAIWLSPVYQSPMVDNGYDVGIIVKSTQFLERYQILISLSISQKN